MILKNGKNEFLEIIFSSGESAAQNFIDCMYYVYGTESNYVNPKMFDIDYLIREIRTGKVEIFTGCAKSGSTAVTISTKRNPYFENSFEIGALAVADDYRGFHLGSAITAHVINSYTSNPAFYAYVVLFYPTAGEVFEKNGFVPTGFLTGFCRSDKHLSELQLRSQKHTLAIYVRRGDCSRAGTVYVPFGLAGLTKKIYTSLDANPVIESSESAIDGLSGVEYTQDDYHRTALIYVSKTGIDLEEKIRAVERQVTDSLQTNILFLNINDSAAICGYEVLRGMDYKFSGFMPLCGECEYIVMAKTHGVILDNSELKMMPALKCLHEEIDAYE